MVQYKLLGVGLIGWVMAGCTLETEEAAAVGDPNDLKPEDGSEFAGNQFGTAQQPHALHYTDGTNLWMETGYPMGTDNPNCKDWYVYDRWLSRRQPIGWSYYSTFETSHNWAQGTDINNWMNTLPSSLGYNDGFRHILVDHNTVVARASAKCSGRYVFQMDNHSGSYDFGVNRYWLGASLPYWTMPRNKAACEAREGTSVPHLFIDLYACEAYDARSVGGSISRYCSIRNNWRKVASTSVYGWWNQSSQRCDIVTGVYYEPLSDKIGVSLNMVIKAGVGHGVAPAEMQIYRYD